MFTKPQGTDRCVIPSSREMSEIPDFTHMKESLFLAEKAVFFLKGLAFS